jgi:hypothetical protein
MDDVSINNEEVINIINQINTIIEKKDFKKYCGII